MNKYQRAVLVSAGVIIALIQLNGIFWNGLEDNRGWAVSFLIATLLLFVGLGSWESIGKFWRKQTPTSAKTAIAQDRSLSDPLVTRAKVKKARKDAPQPSGEGVPPSVHEAYKYGGHISEMDISISAYTSIAEDEELLRPGGIGRSLNWNCCAAVYASMRFAERKKKMNVNVIVWNTIVHAITNRMMDGLDEDLDFHQRKMLEEAAYEEIENINAAVDQSVHGKGTYGHGPVIDHIAKLFGADESGITAIKGTFAHYANLSVEKIIPEQLLIFS